MIDFLANLFLATYPIFGFLGLVGGFLFFLLLLWLGFSRKGRRFCEYVCDLFWYL